MEDYFVCDIWKEMSPFIVALVALISCAQDFLVTRGDEKHWNTDPGARFWFPTTSLIVIFCEKELHAT